MAVEAWSYKRASLAAALAFLMRTAPIGRPQCASPVRGDHPARGDQGFDSCSLQQIVRLSPDFFFLYRKAGSCRGVRGPARAARPAETHRARQHHATAGNISVLVSSPF